MHPISRPLPAIAVVLPMLFALVAVPAAAQELPPEIQMDRYMVQVDREIGGEQYAAVLRTLDRILELQGAHGLELPESFWMKRAEVALGAEEYLEAIASATRYLEVAGREGGLHVAALELLDGAIAQGCAPERMTETLESLRACLAAGRGPERGGRGWEDDAGLGGRAGGSRDQDGAGGCGSGPGGGCGSGEGGCRSGDVAGHGLPGRLRGLPGDGGSSGGEFHDGVAGVGGRAV